MFDFSIKKNRKKEKSIVVFKLSALCDLFNDAQSDDRRRVTSISYAKSFMALQRNCLTGIKKKETM